MKQQLHEQTIALISALQQYTGNFEESRLENFSNLILKTNRPDREVVDHLVSAVVWMKDEPQNYGVKAGIINELLALLPK